MDRTRYIALFLVMFQMDRTRYIALFLVIVISTFLSRILIWSQMLSRQFGTFPLLGSSTKYFGDYQVYHQFLSTTGMRTSGLSIGVGGVRIGKVA